MTNEEKRMAVAGACGWSVKQSPIHKGYFTLFDPTGKQRGGSWSDWREVWTQKLRGNPKIPDYQNDLNAIRAIVWERRNDRGLVEEYSKRLSKVVGEAEWATFALVNATAEQRFEAFGLTLGLWT
jgi:hypothetical protein